MAYFGQACAACPLREQCTRSGKGRTIHVGVNESALAGARARQADPAWQADYRATRPKVERKIGHLMRRKHGGRRARVRGQAKVAADFVLLAAAVNLARACSDSPTSPVTAGARLSSERQYGQDSAQIPPQAGPRAVQRRPPSLIIGRHRRSPPRHQSESAAPPPGIASRTQTGR
jgi:hypothetical protein